MNTINPEAIKKNYLDRISKIAEEITTCFLTLHQVLDQIGQEVDREDLKADIRTFTTVLIQSTAKELVTFFQLIQDALIAQLKAELSTPQSSFTFEHEPDEEQVPWYTVSNEE